MRTHFIFDTAEKQASQIRLVGMPFGTIFMEENLPIANKPNMHLPFDSAILLLRTNHEDTPSTIQNIYAPGFL